MTKNLDDSWQMITITFNGSYLKMFHNGILNSTSYCNITMDYINRDLTYIGKNNWQSHQLYSSSLLDELTFYDNALTQTEITQIFNEIKAPLTCNRNKAYLNCFLTNYWPFTNKQMRDIFNNSDMIQNLN